MLSVMAQPHVYPIPVPTLTGEHLDPALLRESLCAYEWYSVMVDSTPVQPSQVNWYFSLTLKVPPVPRSKQLSLSTLAYLLAHWQCPRKFLRSNCSPGHEPLGTYRPLPESSPSPL